jgi:hypothetical protein
MLLCVIVRLYLKPDGQPEANQEKRQGHSFQRRRAALFLLALFLRNYYRWQAVCEIPQEVKTSNFHQILNKRLADLGIVRESKVTKRVNTVRVL